MADDYGFGQDFAPRTSRNPAAPPPATPINVWGTPAVDAGVPAIGMAPGSTYPIYPYAQQETATAAPVTPPGPAAFAGSPLNTLYGIDSESYLTDDQRKLARQIQGKFDSSMDRRDRELAQYGAPRLASFVEDEALARAMSLARGLNIPVQDALGMVGGGGSPASRGGTGGGGGGPGSTGRAPTGTTTQRAPAAAVAARTTPPGATPSQASKWQQIMGGLSSILPLLIGKTGMNSLMQDGIIGWVKNQFKDTFGTEMPTSAAVSIINGGDGGIAPSDGAMLVNPITGQPMGMDPNAALYNPADAYGPNSGWGGVEPTDPWAGYRPDDNFGYTPYDPWANYENPTDNFGYTPVDPWADAGSYWDTGGVDWGDFSWGDFGY